MNAKNDIYISTSCFRHKKIKDSVILLAQEGFTQIELSGGSDYYPEIMADLIHLKKEYGLSYLCHNYFPPPPAHFVLNLASLNDVIFIKTVEFLKNSLKLALALGGHKFGFHAGFLVNPTTDQLGRPFQKQVLFDKKEAIKRFCEGVKLVLAEKVGVELYIENNVYSHTNLMTYGSNNPFLLTSFEDYCELRSMIDFSPLLDIGHLKVSSQSLGLDFKTQLRSFLEASDYLHISDNDGLHDLNHYLAEGSEVFSLIKNDLHNKILTLEINDDMLGLKKTYQTLCSERFIKHSTK